MKNIYEIISEQKAMVDFNVACHDLSYTVNVMMNEFDYVSEGFGSKVKEIIDKLIKFIKAIINKIKELVGKIFNFFRGNRDKVKKIEDKLKEANENEEAADAKPENVTGKGALSVSFSGEANTIQELLNVAKGKVVLTKIGPLSNKINILNKLDEAESVFEKLTDNMDDKAAQKELENLQHGFFVKQLKKVILNDENCSDVPKRLNELFDDGPENVQVEISSVSKNAIEYITKGGVFGKAVQQVSKSMEDEFNGTINELKQTERKENITEAMVNKMVSEIQQCSTFLTNIFSHTSRATLSAYNQYMALCSKLCDAYVKSKNGNATKKEIRSEKKKMMSSAPQEDPFEGME